METAFTVLMWAGAAYLLVPLALLAVMIAVALVAAVLTGYRD